jgi:hypothetical protein
MTNDNTTGLDPDVIEELKRFEYEQTLEKARTEMKNIEVYYDRFYASLNDCFNPKTVRSHV